MVFIDLLPQVTILELQRVGDPYQYFPFQCSLLSVLVKFPSGTEIPDLDKFPVYSQHIENTPPGQANLLTTPQPFRIFCRVKGFL